MDNARVADHCDAKIQRMQIGHVGLERSCPWAFPGCAFVIHRSF